MRIQNLYFLLLLAFGLARIEAILPSQFSCKDIESNSPQLQLQKFLFCDYDQSVRPTASHRNTTHVFFRLIIQSIDVNAVTNVIAVQSWSWFTWFDEHLNWDPSKYDDIKWIHVPSYLIWVPDIVVHSAVNTETSGDMPITNCWLYHEGNISCVPSTVYEAHCNADHKWWPYDAMNCTLEFGSWSHTENELEFRNVNVVIEGLFRADYQKNLEFDIAPIKTSEHLQTSKFGAHFDTKVISYHIFLRRHTTLYSVAYLLPAIVLMIMTLLTLWLEPKSTERMMIGNISFILHLLCIQHIHWMIPPNGSEPPKLLLFYEVSFALATFSIILTSTLRYVKELNNAAPSWISSSTASVLHSKIGQILLISVLDPKALAKIEINADDNTDLVSFNKKTFEWEYVAILIGWLAFFGVLIAYIVLLAVYFPTRNSGDYAVTT